MNEIQVIQTLIFEFRDRRVMIDRDLADLYHVETKVLNQAVKRNINRFPEDFMFQLTEEETEGLVTNCDRFASLKHSSVTPHAFTEHGVVMLASILRSDIAVRVSVKITRAFVAMRQMLQLSPNERINLLEQKVNGIKGYIEELLTDQNEINEETRAQLDAISEALAQLQATSRPAHRPVIGFRQPEGNK